MIYYYYYHYNFYCYFYYFLPLRLRLLVLYIITINYYYYHHYRYYDDLKLLLLLLLFFYCYNYCYYCFYYCYYHGYYLTAIYFTITTITIIHISQAGGYRPSLPLVEAPLGLRGRGGRSAEGSGCSTRRQSQGFWAKLQGDQRVMNTLQHLATWNWWQGVVTSKGSWGWTKWSEVAKLLQPFATAVTNHASRLLLATSK